MPVFTVQLKRTICVGIEADTAEEAIERATDEDWDGAWFRAESVVEGVEQTED